MAGPEVRRHAHRVGSQTNCHVVLAAVTSRGRRCPSPPPRAAREEEGHPGLHQLPEWLFPVWRLLGPDGVLLITVQRPIDGSRLKYIKRLLKKDFIRLVTTKNNLNFNSQSRNFLKKKKDHKMLFAESYGFNIGLTFWSRIIMPNTFTHVGPSFKYASPTFVFSQSLFNPTRVLCFFKHGTWKMSSLFQVEKRIWSQT